MTRILFFLGFGGSNPVHVGSGYWKSRKNGMCDEYNDKFFC